jgi:hypothetical protein
MRWRLIDIDSYIDRERERERWTCRDEER